MEQNYLDLMRTALYDGFDKPSRTGVGTRFITGAQLKFKLTGDDGSMVLPLLTTKFVSFRLIYTELLWLLSASCNSEVLAQKYNNHIWDSDGSRERLDQRGFRGRPTGDLGPVYGWQWRRWNAPYHYSSTDTKKEDGIDQIQAVIDSIKKDPWGRRHIVSAWNPEQIAEMALPPCHVMFQFVVRPRRKSPTYLNVADPVERLTLSVADSANEPYWLDCFLTQRSGDIPLGIPFNIASYSLLTHMIAHLTGLHAGELIHNIGDAHIYHNQFEGCIQQLARTPKQPPTIRWASPEALTNIDSFGPDSIALEGYQHCPKINFPLST
jgi:thymidylate synthase